MIEEGNISQTDSGDENEFEGYKPDDDDWHVSEFEGEHHVAKMARHVKGNVYKPKYDGKIVLFRGLVFKSVDQFRSTLKIFAVKSRFFTNL